MTYSQIFKNSELKFTPLEFETTHMGGYEDEISVKIYSVGV